MPREYPELYLQGVRLFNAGEFYDCHDVLEELWNETVGPERPLYQGLIQAAVALFHFENGNLGGARRMYESARSYLEPCGPRCQGIDVNRFLADLRSCFRELIEAREYPAGATLPEDRRPLIHFVDDAEMQARMRPGPT